MSKDQKHCPYCDTDIAEKTMKDHLIKNEYMCSRKHEEFMCDCWTLTEQFKAKMNKVAEFMNTKKGIKHGNFR